MSDEERQKTCLPNELSVLTVIFQHATNEPEMASIHNLTGDYSISLLGEIIRQNYFLEQFYRTFCLSLLTNYAIDWGKQGPKDSARGTLNLLPRLTATACFQSWLSITRDLCPLFSVTFHNFSTVKGISRHSLPHNISLLGRAPMFFLSSRWCYNTFRKHLEKLDTVPQRKRDQDGPPRTNLLI